MVSSDDCFFLWWRYSSLGSLVAIVAGTILPYLAARDHRLLKPESEKDDSDSDDDDEEDRELVRIQEMVREWKAEAAREGRPLRLPTSKRWDVISSPEPSFDLFAVPFMLRNIWTCSQLLFGCLMFTTFFINRVWQVSRLLFWFRGSLMFVLIGDCNDRSCR